MKPPYDDIRDRIGDPPKWWDEHGVPRYDHFAPHMIADLHSQEAALVEIACSACFRKLHVSFSNLWEEPIKKYGTPLADKIRSGEIDYGDAPWHFKCPDGPSMGSWKLRVVEYWIRGHNSGAWSGQWRRDPTLEIEFPEMKECE